MKNKGLSIQWIYHYLSTAVFDLMRISLELTQLINAPDISDANKEKLRHIESEARIIGDTLSYLQKEYFNKQE